MTKIFCTLVIVALATPLFGQAENYPDGSTVDAFVITDLEGTVHDLEAYSAAGKYVVLGFFFFDCVPCQQRVPYLSELFQIYGCNSEDLICIQVNDGDPDEAAAAFNEVFAPGFMHVPVVGSAAGHPLVTEYGVSGFPTYCLIGSGRQMIANDIWPIEDMSSFVGAFPDGANIAERPCSVGVEEHISPRGLPAVSATLTDGLVTLTFRSPGTQQAEVGVFDVLGHPVLRASGVRCGSGQAFDLRALANGQYILKVVVGGRVEEMQRIVLIR